MAKCTTYQAVMNSSPPGLVAPHPRLTVGGARGGLGQILLADPNSETALAQGLGVELQGSHWSSAALLLLAIPTEPKSCRPRRGQRSPVGPFACEVATS